MRERDKREKEREKDARVWTYACVLCTDETTYVLNFPPCKSRHESVYTHGIAAGINACVCSRLGGAAGSLSGA